MFPEYHPETDFAYQTLKLHESLRSTLLRGLRHYWDPAHRAAAIIQDETQARWLLEGHRRIPSIERACIYCMAEPSGTPDVHGAPFAYTDALAGEFTRLVFVGSDIWYPGPANRTEFDAADQLLARLLQLGMQESNALQILLEAANLSLVATISYTNWWTPVIMRRLLESPDLDRLNSHV